MEKVSDSSCSPGIHVAFHHSYDLEEKEESGEAVEGCASLKASRLTKVQEWPISDLEELLMTWIEDQTQK